MNFHEIIVMAIAILGIQAGVYRRPMVTPLAGTYIMTLQEVRTTDQARGNAQQPIDQRFQVKSNGRGTG